MIIDWRPITEAKTDEALFVAVSAAIEAIGFDGYKFCLVWQGADCLFSKNIAAEGIMTNSFGAGSALKHASNDYVLRHVRRSSTPLVWDAHRHCAQDARTDAPDSAFARRTLKGASDWAASVPVQAPHSALNASLCVFSRSGLSRIAPDALARAFGDLQTLGAFLLIKSEAVRHFGRPALLTDSEDLAFSMLSKGLRVKDIARQLRKSERTIQSQIESARVRLGARTTFEALSVWAKRGDLSDHERSSVDLRLLGPSLG